MNGVIYSFRMINDINFTNLNKLKITNHKSQITNNIQ